VEIRAAVLADFEVITAIYNDIVLHSTATYNDTPATLDERVAWWRSRHAQDYPVLVAVEDDAVIGFASFGDFRPWPGYRHTVEGTIHLATSARGQGHGRQLLDALVERARGLGKHIMIAGVDSGNAASLRFLTRYGFKQVGQLHEVGYKFGRYLDLVFLQYWLTPRGELPLQQSSEHGVSAESPRRR
jgi:L-amino acid N-acyltransferase YncA